MKITKLDRRHTGFGVFQYRIDTYRKHHRWSPPMMTAARAALPKQTAPPNIYQLREWCWQTWGPSKELEYYTEELPMTVRHSENPHWAWSNNEHRCAIYLASDIELTMFNLKWI